MTKRIVQGLMALAVLLLCTTAVQARDLIQNIQFDVFALAGGSTLADAQYWTSAGNLYHSKLEVGPKYTVGVAVPYGKLLSIETAFSTGPNNLVITNTNANPRVNVLYPVHFYCGSLSGVVHSPFSLFHIRPYGAAGIEYDRYSPTSAAIAKALNQGFATVSTAIMTHNDKLGVNVGIGFDRKIMKRVTLRIDLRDHVTGSPAFGLPPKPTIDNLGSFPASGRANNIEYTAGLVFHLGKF